MKGWGSKEQFKCSLKVTAWTKQVFNDFKNKYKLLTLIQGCSKTSAIVGRLCGFGESIFKTNSLAFDDIAFHSGLSN